MSSKKGFPLIYTQKGVPRESRGYLESKEEGEEEEERENQPREEDLIGLVGRFALICFVLVDLKTLDWNLWIALDLNETLLCFEIDYDDCFLF